MNRELRLGRSLFSIGLGALGLLSVVSADFAYDWQPVPASLPARPVFAVICGLVMTSLSVALLVRRTSALATRVLLPFLLVWLGLKVPVVIAVPQIEGVWIGFGEVGMLLAGGWILFSRYGGLAERPLWRVLSGDRGVQIARVVFGLAIIPVGLGHLFYASITATLVPSWLPFRTGLAVATGVAQLACGLALLLSIRAKLAAYLEAVLLALFAAFVWGPDTWFSSVPKMAGTPTGPRFPLTAFFITWVIGASALLIAESYRRDHRLLEIQTRPPQA